jgi:hypothetical protein
MRSVPPLPAPCILEPGGSVPAIGRLTSARPFRHDTLRRQDWSRAGFSLAESLICALITVVICLLVAEMSGNLVGGVSTASGRVNAIQKLELLRTTLGNDLARLPHLEDSVIRLSAEGDDDRWQLTLLLPARPDLLRAEGRPWERVRYTWEKQKAAFYRQRDLTDNRLSEPELICPGVLTLGPEWLSNTVADPAEGPRDWDRAQLPTFLRLRPHLTEVWEEGRLENLRPEASHGRDFEVLLPVSGNP